MEWEGRALSDWLVYVSFAIIFIYTYSRKSTEREGFTKSILSIPPLPSCLQVLYTQIECHPTFSIMPSSVPLLSLLSVDVSRLK